MTWDQSIIDVATGDVTSTSSFSDEAVRRESPEFEENDRILVVTGTYGQGYFVLLRNDTGQKYSIPPVSLIILKRAG